MNKLLMLIVLASANVFADPLDDATALVFEWLVPPAPQSDWPEFNSALTNVINTAAAARAATESLEFAQDRLVYHRELHIAGELGEAELWQHARLMVEARQTDAQRRVEYVQALHALSKRWGGERWWELRELIIAATEWHPVGCAPADANCK